MKRLIALILSILICTSMLVTGSVAYFTDEDEDTNVFSVGNVNIDQHEYERGDNGLEPFEQDQKLRPIVENTDEEKTVTETLPAGEVELRNPDRYRNYIDKIVTVENTGVDNAYLRNIIAIPNGGVDLSATPWLEFDFFDASNAAYGNQITEGTQGDHWKLSKIQRMVTIESITYDLYVFDYIGTNGIFAPDAHTLPTLLGFGLSPNVDYDENKGSYYYRDGNAIEYITLSADMNKILVVSQAVQVQGFEDFADAFSRTFKEINATQHPWADVSTGGAVTPEQPGEVRTVRPDPSGLDWNGLAENEYVVVNEDNYLIAIDESIEDLTVEKVSDIKIIGNGKGELKTLKINDSSLEKISSLSNMPKLITIDFGSNSVDVSPNAFEGCDSLTTVLCSSAMKARLEEAKVFPDSVTILDAFK